MDLDFKRVSSLEKFQEAKEYWKERLNEEISLNTLPVDYTGNIENSKLKEFFKLDGEVMSMLIEKSKNNDIAIYVILLSILNVLVLKYSNDSNVTIATPIYKGNDELNKYNDWIFINNSIDDSCEFRTLLNRAKGKVTEAFKRQIYPISEIVKDTCSIGQAEDLYKTIFVYNNIQQSDKVSSLIESKENYITFEFTKCDTEIVGNVIYNPSLYCKDTINAFIEQYKCIIEKSLTNMNILVKDLNLKTYKHNKAKISEQYDFIIDKSIHMLSIKDLFEEVASKNCENQAIVSEGKSYTYGYINKKANQLARAMLKRGIGENSIVGLYMRPSLETIIGLFAILKTGGAYVAIDSDFPEERINYIINDSSAELILTQLEDIYKGDLNNIVIDLNNTSLFKGEDSNLQIVVSPTNLIYIIYTSGTTGNPKGVMIENKSVVNYVKWFISKQDINSNDSSIIVSSLAFDLAYTSLYSSLLTGATVHLPSKILYTNPKTLIDYIYDNNITFFKCTPSLFSLICNSNYFSENDKLRNLRLVVQGGENINITDIEKFHSKYKETKLMNHYGPTETTIGVVAQNIDFSNFDLYRKATTIGSPISNTNIFILDKNDKLMPEKAIGEICIAGLSLARGYINANELNNNKFPYIDINGERIRIYRTGDVGRYVNSGVIQFLGRSDLQVKVNGYRVDLKEIENAILSFNEVNEVVVTQLKDSDKICAYFVADSEIDKSGIREYLTNHIPVYAIPSYFLRIDSIPLTLNGKIDYRKLLAIDVEGLKDYTQVVPPKNEKEEILLELFKEILGYEDIGINHNFFSLGGDSIKAIQLIGKLQQKDLKLNISDLFRYQTVEKISLYLVEDLNKSFQGIVTGEVDLTPIQIRFFENDLEYVDHYNHSLIFFKRDGFDFIGVEAVFNRLIEHHDVLRMKYEFLDRRIIQYNRGLGEKSFRFALHDYREVPNYRALIKQNICDSQETLSLKNGLIGLVKVFNTIEGDYLSITIHHMIIDGVSWRILLEDFNNLYNQYLNNEEFNLPKKTDSFLEWSLALKEYSTTERLKSEAAYWNKVDNDYINFQLPKIKSLEKKFLGENVIVTASIDKAYTTKLLKHVNNAFNTDVKDILLTALTLSLCELSKSSCVKMDLEGHGREDIKDNLDISRTIGWFTSVFPVGFNIDNSISLGEKIKYIKETLRSIPNNGIGYGVLKYLLPYKENKPVKRECTEVIFNYLGQTDSTMTNSMFKNADIEITNTVSERLQAKYSLYVDGIILDSEFQMNFGFNPDEIRLEDITLLSKSFIGNLESIIDYCISRPYAEKTLSDFENVDLNKNEIDIINRKYNVADIEDIYPLSPMQEGMFFYWITSKEKDMYNEQYLYKLNGEIDIKLLQDSLDILVDRHDILRTSFLYKDITRPHQIVHTHNNITINILDYSNNSKADEDIESYRVQDRLNGFDLEKAKNFRISLFKTGASNFEILFSFHHILMDGWCVQIILEELFLIYKGLRLNGQINLPKIHQYKEYIKWLENQDKLKCGEYWREYVKETESVTELPFKKVNKTGGYENKRYSYKIDLFTTEAIKQIASKNKCTVYNVLQSIWAILLSKYNAGENVTFGTVVSGRTTDISDVDKLVGLFINTVPVVVEIKNNMRFNQIINCIKQDYVEMESYFYYPLAEIQNYSKLRSSLISHIMIYENYPVNEKIRDEKNNDLGFNFIDVKDYWKTNYDFNMIIIPGDELMLNIAYNGLVFEQQSIISILEHFKNILTSVIEDNEIDINDIEIITDKEKDYLFNEINNTDYPVDTKLTINEVFTKQVLKQRENTALIFNDESISYIELEKRANKVARILLDRGLQGNELVGVLLNRSINMIATLLGILKAGGAYVPIDTENPTHRINYMLENSEVRFLITEEKLIGSIEYEGKFIFANRLIEEYDASVENYNLSKADDLAYMIFTSGSTGNPKGVCIEHKSAVNFTQGLKHAIPMGEQSVMLCITTISFDIFFLESISALMLGNKVILADERQQINPKAIGMLIYDNGINVMQMTPSRMKLLLSDDFSRESLDTVEVIILGGEPTSLELLNEIRMLTKARIFNLYGPTETTIWSTYCELTDMSYVSIGKPMLNTEIYVMDNYCKLVPPGVPGELFIGGLGLARGYYNNEETTKEKFVQNPFNKNRKIYKTGDIVKLLPDGNIIYVGRKDFQVKIRGYRIEIGEIEATIRDIREIKDVVVIAKEDKQQGDNYLVAYYTCSCDVDADSIRNVLKKSLPYYMIPSFFVQIERIPLNQNGKVNRKELPEVSNVGAKERIVIKPQNKTEQVLYRLWTNLLKLEDISIDDNFFEIGGHSLKAVMLASLMQKEGLNVNINDIFNYPTIERLGIYVDKKHRDNGLIDDIEGFNQLVKSLGLQCVIKKISVDDTYVEILLVENISLDKNIDLKESVLDKLSDKIHPHYVKYIDNYNDTRNYSNDEIIKELFIEAGKDCIIDDFKREYILATQYNFENLLNNSILHQYDISGTQQVRLLNPQIPTIVMNLGKNLNIDKLRSVLLRIINEQGMLRNMLFYNEDQEKYYWNEYSIQSDFKLPIIDLTEISPKNTCSFYREIYEIMKSSEFNLDVDILFKAVVIKENLKNNILLLTVNHLIFDGFSSEILKTRIIQLYNDDCENKEKEIIPYYRYLEEVSKGPTMVSEDSIIDYFKLKDFNRALETLNLQIDNYDQSEGTYLKLEIPYNFTDPTQDFFMISIKLLIRLIEKYFKLNAVPILLINYGRMYQGKTYYNTIGEFIDYVPFYFDIEDYNLDILEHEVKEKLDFASQNNIKFTELIFNENLKNRYTKISSYIQDLFNSSFVVFNFQGLVEDKDAAIKRKFVKDDVLRKFGRSTQFNSRIINDRFEIELILPFSIKSEIDLKNFLIDSFNEFVKIVM